MDDIPIGAYIVLGLIAHAIVYGLIARHKTSPQPPLPLSKQEFVETTQHIFAPYLSCGHLFTPAERLFLFALEQVISAEYRVFGKVRLSDIVKTDSVITPDFYTHNISLQHIDYVVCRRTDLTVVSVIELDDQSHSESSAKLRDTKKAAALASAQIPLIRFQAQFAYDLAAIYKSLKSCPALHGLTSSTTQCPLCHVALLAKEINLGFQERQFIIRCSDTKNCGEVIATSHPSTLPQKQALPFST